LRYKQTALGVLWAVIQPFFTMVISRCCSAAAKIPPTDPGPVFYFSALGPGSISPRP